MYLIEKPRLCNQILRVRYRALPEILTAACNTGSDARSLARNPFGGSNVQAYNRPKLYCTKFD